MCFDYGIYKKRITDLCKKWNEIFILPSKSKYLKIEETETKKEIKLDETVSPL